jgi:phosphatidylserine/phosphatidylglycerophosphate/cardiolipin synthase-like enzyme
VGAAFSRDCWTARTPRPHPPLRPTGLSSTVLRLSSIFLILLLSACTQPPAAWPPNPPTVTGPPAIATPAAGSWYELYFTTPEQTANVRNPTGGIPDAIIASLAEARQSLDVAVYEFNWQPLADALLAAHARGLTVRLVTDTDSMSQDTIRQLKAAGVPVVEDARDAIMHDKFVILDGAAVWTGSMNFTHSDAYRNNNNVLYLRSTRLAQNYTREFEEMFKGYDFGAASAANTPNPVITLDGTRLENYFAPEDEVAGQILPVLRAAERSIFFMAFAFTRQDFADALLERAADGVNVRGVFETRQIAAGANQAWDLLTIGGLAANVRQDGNPYNLHHKVFIVDEAIVITGSYNFSRNADERNDENVLIIHSPAIAAAYLAEWEKVWDLAGQ